MSAKSVAAKVRAAKSPAEVERITRDLSPEQTAAVVRQLEGGQR